MKQEKATLDAILNSIVDGVITIDHLGTIASFNNAAESLFGYSADELRSLGSDERSWHCIREGKSFQ
jgi:PAS domain S-box-containing protein